MIDITVEPIASVQHVVPEIVKHRAMEAIRPRTSHDRNLSAWRSAELGSVRGRLYAEFLHCIDRDEAIRPSKNAEGAQRST